MNFTNYILEYIRAMSYIVVIITNIFMLKEKASQFWMIIANIVLGIYLSVEVYQRISDDKHISMVCFTIFMGIWAFLNLIAYSQSRTNT